MQVRAKRWGEVTIKRQGRIKNKFVQTKSFSIDGTENGYTLEQYWDILKLVTDSTKDVGFAKLKGELKGLLKRTNGGGRDGGN